MRHDRSRPNVIEIEVQPDAGGAQMLRDLADILDPPGRATKNDNTVVELPLAMPDKLDHASLVALAEALDEMGVLNAEPVPAFKLRRSKFKVLP